MPTKIRHHPHNARTRPRHGGYTPPHVEVALLALVDKRIQPTSLTAATAADLLDRLDDGVTFLVSEKTDGTRAWLTAANGAVALHDRAGGRRFLGRCSQEMESWTPLLLDGELIADREGTEALVLFDTHAARGRDTRVLPLRMREKIYKAVARTVRRAGPVALEAKPWLPGDEWRKLPCVEGVVWQHVSQLSEVFKYKRCNTVDLRWTGGRFPTAKALAMEIEPEGRASMKEGTIYELAPTESGAWRVLHERPDKTRENGKKTIMDAISARGLNLHADFV